MPKESRKDLIRQYATAGLTGGIGRMADKATHRGVSRAAEKAAGAYKRRRRKKKPSEIQKPEKKLTGVGFWMIVSLAIIKDSFDIIATATMVAAILTVLAGIFISFIILFYLFYNDVNFTTKKLATIAIFLIIELIPFLNVLPMATANLLVVRYLENNERLRKFAQKKAKIFAKT